MSRQPPLDMQRWIFWALALVLWLWRAEPTDRYVDSSYMGPTEAGTPEQPCKSISKCVYEFAQTGDTILLQPGNYNGSDNVGICSELVARSNCSATGLTISGFIRIPRKLCGRGTRVRVM